jgi:hypothetical protein
MTERLSTTNASHEKNELQEVSLAQNERLRQERERAIEQAPEKTLNKEKALENVEKALEKKEVEQSQENATTKNEHTSKRPLRTKKSLETSFKTQMKDIRNEMPVLNRTFSKIIHTKAVETTSEAIGSTLARPNAILSGSIVAFILTAGFYFWAKYVGYPLSGFETIGAFIVGWLIGIIFDFTRIMFTGKS